VKVEWILLQAWKTLLTWWGVEGIIRSAFSPSQTRARNLHGMVRVFAPSHVQHPSKTLASPLPTTYSHSFHFSNFAISWLIFFLLIFVCYLFFFKKKYAKK